MSIEVRLLTGRHGSAKLHFSKVMKENRSKIKLFYLS